MSELPPHTPRMGTRPTATGDGRAISVGQLVDDEGLGVELEVAAGADGLDRQVRAARIQKSGLALAGHFHGIESSRVQIFGVTEMSFLAKLPRAACGQAVRKLLALDLCCVVVTEASRNAGWALDELVARCDETSTPLLLSPERSSATITALHALLDERLAPRMRVHGVLVDVFEVGLLLLGSSGVGKSEVALELVMRGHRLVADDVVECHFRPPGMVFGAPADLLRHHLEVRGLGILNVKDLFGVTAIRERKRIDVVVQLTEPEVADQQDRLGIDQRCYHLLGVDITEILIPVTPGRDIASILEIAARHELLRSAGHHPARAFFNRLEGTLLGVNVLEESAVPSPAQSSAAMSPPPESSVGLPYRKNR